MIKQADFSCLLEQLRPKCPICEKILHKDFVYKDDNNYVVLDAGSNHAIEDTMELGYLLSCDNRDFLWFKPISAFEARL